MGVYVRALMSLFCVADKIESLPDIQPLFITVDPARDTPAVIKEYLKGHIILRLSACHRYCAIDRTVTFLNSRFPPKAAGFDRH